VTFVKVGARPGGADRRDNLNFRRQDAAGYWEVDYYLGETE
jgi:hypothetical protein